MHSHDLDRARDALYAIPPDCDRATWVKAGMAFHAAGGGFDDFDTWSAQAESYNAADCRSTFRSFKTVPGGVGAGALFGMASDYGWTNSHQGTVSIDYEALTRKKPATKPVEAPRKPAPGMSPAEVFARCEPATNAHSYIVAKGAAGVPLDDLRVVPDGDSLHIAGQSMAGFLMVPAYAPDGELQSAQFIPPPGSGKKVNLPGASMAGATYTVGPIDGPAHLCEGIGQALAVLQATGHRAVCCFGWGNVRRVAENMRERDPNARLVLVPDAGKEGDAAKIAADVGAAIAAMPDGWPKNSDVSDLAQREGLDSLTLLLEAATEPPRPAPRYKVMAGADLDALPPISWRIKGIFPSRGIAAIYGPSKSGKSFLGFDASCAIAEGSPWFGYRTKAADVVMVCLEGESGYQQRAQAWKMHYGRALPERLRIVMQPFRLTEPKDIADLAAVIPPGAVVIVDTMNRAAPMADENSSRDMGEIIEGAKTLQSVTDGLVVLIAHTGKDTSKGLRGHSSLGAALDGAIEVSRDGDRRQWSSDKVKDGKDGAKHPFSLKVLELGRDEDDDPLTSCAVEPDGIDAPKAYTKPLSARQTEAMQAYRRAAALNGLLDDEGNFAGLHRDVWREAFYVSCAADSQSAKQKAFVRAIQDLTRLGQVSVKDDVFFLEGATSEFEQGLFAKSLLEKQQNPDTRTDAGQVPDMSGLDITSTPDRHGHDSIGVSGCPAMSDELKKKTKRKPRQLSQRRKTND